MDYPGHVNFTNRPPHLQASAVPLCASGEYRRTRRPVHPLGWSATRTKGPLMEPIHYYATTLVSPRYDDRELLQRLELHHVLVQERRTARQARQQRMRKWISTTASRLMHPDVATTGRPSESRIDLGHRGA